MITSEEQELERLLHAFHASDLGRHFVLIGSWCLLIYHHALRLPRPSFTTTDVDFSVRRPKDIGPLRVDRLLGDLGYIVEAGLLGETARFAPAPDQLQNRLRIEFIGRHGRLFDVPALFQNLGITITPMPYQELLLDHAIQLLFRRIPVSVPKPEAWTAHKMAVSQLRQGVDADAKRVKDLDGARRLLGSIGLDPVLRFVETQGVRKFKALFRAGLAELRETWPESNL